ncbi:CS025 protein, partial [Indicator maculatus]|nr:CS025 protein [Indicator maculatus]
MSSKVKRVLPTRPEPPSVEQILADVQSTHPGDPIFILPTEPSQDHSPSSGEPLGFEERERLYQLSRSYVGMNQQLQEARERLREQREELLRARAALEHDIAHMRQKAC